ncbi:MAG: M48 family metalloprotease, partial [Planctomycetota bacterium]
MASPRRWLVLVGLAFATIVPLAVMAVLPATVARGTGATQYWNGEALVPVPDPAFAIDVLVAWLSAWLVFWQAMAFVRPSRKAARLTATTPVTDDALLARIAGFAARLAIPPPRVLQHRDEHGPAVAAWAFGGLVPTIVIDEGVCLRLPREQADAVIAHELGHVARHHAARFLFAALAVAFATMLVSGVVHVGIAVVWLLACRTVVFVHVMQREEFAADRLAAESVGARAMADALDNTHAANQQHATHPFLHALLTHPHRDERLLALGRPANKASGLRARRARDAAAVLAIAALGGSVLLGVAGHVAVPIVLLLLVAVTPAVLMLLMLPFAQLRSLRALGVAIPNARVVIRWALLLTGVVLLFEVGIRPAGPDPWLLVPLACLLAVFLFGRCERNARVRLGRYARALDFAAWRAEYDRLPERVRQRPDLWLLRCEVAWRDGPPAAAFAAMDALLARWPRYHFARFTRLAWLRNDPQASLLEARDLAARLPDHPLVRLALAASLRRAGQADAAWPLVQEALRREPHIGTHHALAARIAIARGDLPAARALVATAERLAVGDAHVLLAALDLAVAEGRTDAPERLAALQARLPREPFLHLEVDVQALARRLDERSAPTNR